MSVSATIAKCICWSSQICGINAQLTVGSKSEREEVCKGRNHTEEADGWARPLRPDGRLLRGDDLIT
jgi:hypothetical protein